MEDRSEVDASTARLYRIYIPWGPPGPKAPNFLLIGAQKVEVDDFGVLRLHLDGRVVAEFQSGQWVWWQEDELSDRAPPTTSASGTIPASSGVESVG